MVEDGHEMGENYPQPGHKIKYRLFLYIHLGSLAAVVHRPGDRLSSRLRFVIQILNLFDFSPDSEFTFPPHQIRI